MKLSTHFVTLTLIGLTLIGCGGDTKPQEKMSFDVTVKNLTLAQPFSPLTVVAHKSDYTLYTLGKPASEALEHLSEGGDNSYILATDEIETFASTTPLVPGSTETIHVETDENYLSLAAMLVNTNDAFVGVRNFKLESMEVGETKTYTLNSYDSGTEVNSEEAADIPGPAGGGEGFNAQRDDHGFVSVHAGTITAADGLSTSALTYQHKWDNPTAIFTITRKN